MCPLAVDRAVLLNAAHFSRSSLGVLSPAVLAALGPTVVTSDDAGGSPLADSRSGSVFTDGGDASAHWYLPDWSLRTPPDAAFTFAAVRDGSDIDGHPFNRATLTVGLRKVVPDDAAALLAARPPDGSGPPVSEIPLTSLGGSLLLSGKASDGTEVTHEIAGQVSVDADDGALATFTALGLVGPDVILAFVNLTATNRAQLSLAYSFQVVRWAGTGTGRSGGVSSLGLRDLIHRQFEPRLVVLPPGPVPIAAPEPLTTAAVQLRVQTVASPQVGMMARSLASPAVNRFAFSDPDARVEILHLPPRLGAPDAPASRTAVHETLTETLPLELGGSFATPSSRPSYTLTADGSTRGIVDVGDLEEFRAVQSEYVELTVLGDIGAKYPTLRAAYLGQVSGTVVAIPAAYGVIRTPGGLLAACHAVVDPSATSASGCRFQFTFGLGPVVDPGDLARLAADLQAEPSLAGRDLYLSLPTDLDRSVPSTLQTSSVSNLGFVVGLVPNTFAVTADVVDGQLPAVAVANLLLRQFADPRTQSLVGRIALRLDDAHVPPVAADVILNLAVTAPGDDVATVLTPGGDAMLSNQSALALLVSTVTTDGGGGLVTSASQERLPANGTCVIDLPDGADQLLASCTLDLPTPSAGSPGPQPTDYVTVTVENVQRIHHPLGFNAAGQFGTDIASVLVQIALDKAPDVPVPTIALSPGHPIDNTAVEVPVQFALEGLAATVALTVTPVGGGPAYDRSLEHDFLDGPILVLTHQDLMPPQG